MTENRALYMLWVIKMIILWATEEVHRKIYTVPSFGWGKRSGGGNGKARKPHLGRGEMGERINLLGRSEIWLARAAHKFGAGSARWQKAAFICFCISISVSNLKFSR